MKVKAGEMIDKFPEEQWWATVAGNLSEVWGTMVLLKLCSLGLGRAVKSGGDEDGVKKGSWQKIEDVNKERINSKRQS